MPPTVVVPVNAKDAAPTEFTLEDFLAEIAHLTGLHLCIYDVSDFTSDTPHLKVSAPSRWHYSAFCQGVKSNPDAAKKCIAEEYHRLELSAHSSKPLIHTCHAGLTDLILPLKKGQKLIGALYLGQAFTQSPQQARRTLEKLRRQYGFSPDEILRWSAETPRISKGQLETFVPILHLLKRYIEQNEELVEWQNNSIIVHESPVTRGEFSMEMIPLPTLDQLRPSSPHIIESLQILRHSYWRGPTLHAIAREVGMSQSHFSRRFRAETGTSFRQCLLETRIVAASYLLKRTSLSVKEIALMLGYKDSTSFVRAFRGFVGLTPHTFIRRQSRQ